MNTAGKAWLVCRQFYKSGERFRDLDEAKVFAEALAKRIPGEKVEIFECIGNVYSDVPLKYEGASGSAEVIQKDQP